MRAIRVASAVVMGVTTIALTAPAASALITGDHDSDPFQVGAEPRTIAAGGRVMLNATGCEGDTTVTAGVFDTVTLRKGGRPAPATIDRDARQGASYSVAFRCSKGSTRNVDLTIAQGRQEGEDRQENGRDRQENGRDRQENGRDREEFGREGEHESQRHGVRAGIGGTVAGFDLQKIGLGAALITGAISTSYYLSRRRGTDDES
ncbi:hypothetical protein ACFVT5_32095 [Streptomyces sp. NPDC058001]|uniref:hypothetical protein n=1 Tax=Streptomyces sp. NPDC058001 TaxID=3346300 RepID=UPI0036E04108